MEYSHTIVNQMTKATELIIEVLKGTVEVPEALLKVIDHQTATISELRAELHRVNAQLGQMQSKAVSNAIFSGTNVVHQADGSTKTF